MLVSQDDIADLPILLIEWLGRVAGDGYAEGTVDSLWSMPVFPERTRPINRDVSTLGRTNLQKDK